MRSGESDDIPRGRAFDAGLSFERLRQDQPRAARAAILGRLHEKHSYNKGKNKVQAQISRKKAPAA
jgi:hypothetical protein